MGNAMCIPGFEVPASDKWYRYPRLFSRMRTYGTHSSYDHIVYSKHEATGLWKRCAARCHGELKAIVSDGDNMDIAMYIAALALDCGMVAADTVFAIIPSECIEFHKKRKRKWNVENLHAFEHAVESGNVSLYTTIMSYLQLDSLPMDIPASAFASSRAIDYDYDMCVDADFTDAQADEIDRIYASAVVRNSVRLISNAFGMGDANLGTGRIITSYEGIPELVSALSMGTIEMPFPDLMLGELADMALAEVQNRSGDCWPIYAVEALRTFPERMNGRRIASSRDEARTVVSRLNDMISVWISSIDERDDMPISLIREYDGTPGSVEPIRRRLEAIADETGADKLVEMLGMGFSIEEVVPDARTRNWI